jgi:hypothetical protein
MLDKYLLGSNFLKQIPYMKTPSSSAGTTPIERCIKKIVEALSRFKIG